MTREVVYACAKKNEKRKRKWHKSFPIFIILYHVSMTQRNKIIRKGMALISVELLHFSNNRKIWENEIFVYNNLDWLLPFIDYYNLILRKISIASKWYWLSS